MGMRRTCQGCGYALSFLDWVRGWLRPKPLPLTFRTFAGASSTRELRYVCRFCEHNGQEEAPPE